MIESLGSNIVAYSFINYFPDGKKRWIEIVINDYDVYKSKRFKALRLVIMKMLKENVVFCYQSFDEKILVEKLNENNLWMNID